MYHDRLFVGNDDNGNLGFLAATLTHRRLEVWQMEHRNSRCTLCDAEASEIYTICQCASCHQVRGFHHLPRRPCVRFAHRTKVRFPSWESPSAYVFAEGASRITPDAPFPLNEMPFSTPNIATTGRMHTPHTQSPGVAETYTSFFLLPFPLASSAPDRNGVFSVPPHPTVGPR